MRTYLMLLTTLVAVAAHATPDNTMIDREPPAPIYEVIPAEKPGYVWTPGYWFPNKNKQLVWKSGRMIAERPGYEWAPSGWINSGDNWYFVEGSWKVDESYEMVEEEELATPVVASAPKKIKRKRAKKIDYSDTKRWPRIIIH